MKQEYFVITHTRTIWGEENHLDSHKHEREQQQVEKALYPFQSYLVERKSRIFLGEQIQMDAKEAEEEKDE